MVYLTRRYRFAASHRLHSDGLTEERNRQVYGKCNNPYGHGHNYVLEVTVVGPVEPTTGMVYDLVKLDGIVQREVLERFDHTYLNLDVESFRHVVPTTENLCVEVFRLLDDKLREGATRPVPSLARVRLEETSSNYFEYAGEKELPRGM
jgi:6-pyruvoyltetrahydropterin/6-carboxytetrahydropterin synthase